MANFYSFDPHGELGFPVHQEIDPGSKTKFQLYVDSQITLQQQNIKLTTEINILKRNMERYTKESVEICELWRERYTVERCLRVAADLENKLMRKKYKKS
jgi:hypothetical protein